MRNFILIIIVLIIPANYLFAQHKKDSIYTKLDKVMENKDNYVASKEQNIQSLKNMMSISTLSPLQIYDVNLKLYEEYEKYISDSAVHYVLKNIEIAESINNKELESKAEIQLAKLYSTTGLYIESMDILEKIDKSSLSKELLPFYYETLMGFYSHYGQSNNKYINYERSEQYRDSLLSVLDPHSLKYQITYATKVLYMNEYEEAEKQLLALLDKTTDKDIERALIAYLLGYRYKVKKDIELQKKYYSISAITDVENCIKDNASLQSLALVYYEDGNIDLAYKFIQSAIDDAVFCNVRYRTVEGSGFYPIINASYQEKEKKQKDELQTYLILISILSVALIVGIVYVYKQLKRISQIRKELYRTNKELLRLNEDLKTLNVNLQEANHVKEEYIAHFFDLCSTYIDKWENYRKLLGKKAANNQLDELFKILKSNTIVESELEELYKNFDTIFLSIYPTFVEDFNNLLIPEERIYPKQGELLNTELRIFALIRLGITDSVKIANFLRYSLRTVYNYRTKVRNKAAGSRDEFEEIVKKIGIFQNKN